ncbi:MAG: hypothetical protein ABI239_07935 [Aquihabitans sp.]
MSVDGWSLIRFLHVLAAMVFVGGQLVLSGMVLPIVRKDLEPERSGPLARKTARLFGHTANIVLLPTLIVTGLALMSHRGIGWVGLGEEGYGRLLSIKLGMVVLSVALLATHGIIAMRNPAKAKPFAVAGLTASVLIVVFATALVP